MRRRFIKKADVVDVSGATVKVPLKKFEVDYSKFVSGAGNELSAATVAIYKTSLNHLATNGFENIEDLMEKKVECVKFIEEYFPDKPKRRRVLSAIFKVLAEVPFENRVEYYEAFQRAKEEINRSEL